MIATVVSNGAHAAEASRARTKDARSSLLSPTDRISHLSCAFGCPVCAVAHPSSIRSRASICTQRRSQKSHNANGMAGRVGEGDSSCGIAACEVPLSSSFSRLSVFFVFLFGNGPNVE